MKIELIENCKPQYVTSIVYNSLCQFLYSDTKKRIKIGDLIRWVYKILDKPIKLENDSICEKELILVNWEKTDPIMNQCIKDNDYDLDVDHDFDENRWEIN